MRVRRSRLVGDVYYAIYSADDATGLIVEDSDIQGGVLFGDGFIGRRNHAAETAVRRLQ